MRSHERIIAALRGGEPFRVALGVTIALAVLLLLAVFA